MKIDPPLEIPFVWFPRAGWGSAEFERNSVSSITILETPLYRPVCSLVVFFFLVYTHTHTHKYKYIYKYKYMILSIAASVVTF